MVLDNYIQPFLTPFTLLRKDFSLKGHLLLARRLQDLIPWKMIYKLSSVLGDHYYVLQPYAAYSAFTFTALECDDHPFLEHLGVIQGPLPVDNGHIVGAVEAKAMAYLAA